MEIRGTPLTVEILHKGTRVSSHVRSRGRGHAVTNHEHRPKSHQAHLEWPPSRMVQWAQKIGPHTAQLFERMMADKPHPEMGYRGCLGVIRLAGKYSNARMEAAAERALLTGACRYRSIESILKNSLDRQSLPASSTAPPTTPPHDNIRGRGVLRLRRHHAARTDDAKTAGHAVTRHGGRSADARARSQRSGTQLSGAAGPAGGSPIGTGVRTRCWHGGCTWPNCAAMLVSRTSISVRRAGWTRARSARWHKNQRGCAITNTFSFSARRVWVTAIRRHTHRPSAFFRAAFSCTIGETGGRELWASGALCLVRTAAVSCAFMRIGTTRRGITRNARGTRNPARFVGTPFASIGIGTTHPKPTRNARQRVPHNGAKRDANTATKPSGTTSTGKKFPGTTRSARGTKKTVMSADTPCASIANGTTRQPCARSARNDFGPRTSRANSAGRPSALAPAASSNTTKKGGIYQRRVKNARKTCSSSRAQSARSGTSSPSP